MPQEIFSKTGLCPNCKCQIRISYESEQEIYLPRKVKCECGKSLVISGKARPSSDSYVRESTSNGLGREAGPEAPAPVEKLAESTILQSVRTSIGVLNMMASDYSASELADNLTSILQQLAPLLDAPARPVANAEIRRLMVELSTEVRGLTGKFESGRQGISKAIAGAATEIREANAQARSNLAAGLADIVRLQKSQAESVSLAACESVSEAAESVIGDASMSRLENRLAASLKEAFNREVGENRELRIDDVLELFDIVDGHYRFWKYGDEQTPEEQASRPQVVAQLTEFRTRMHRWAARQRLEAFPDAVSGMGRFDEVSHRRVDTEKTGDPSLDGLIARVTLTGYLWKKQLVRKADVIVYKYAPIATPAEPVGHE